MSDHTEVIGRELVTLIRGTKALHHLGRLDGQPATLDPAAFALLSRVCEHGPLRPSVLAGLLCLDLSTISRQITDLEVAGWVGRERDPHDGRASLLRVTPAGRDVVVAGYAQRTRALGQLLADWSDDDREVLATALHRLNEALNEAIAVFRCAAPAQATEQLQENV